jgi:hypothetical protein
VYVAAGQDSNILKPFCSFCCAVTAIVGRCRLVQVELATLQLHVRFEQLRVAELGDQVWQGVKNKYWHFPLYFLPVVTHAAAAEGKAEDVGQQQQLQQQDDQR